MGKNAQGNFCFMFANTFASHGLSQNAPGKENFTFFDPPARERRPRGPPHRLRAILPHFCEELGPDRRLASKEEAERERSFLTV